MCKQNASNAILHTLHTYTGEDFIHTKRGDDQADAQSLDALQKDEHKDFQQWAFVLQLEDNKRQRNGDGDREDDGDEARQHVTAQNFQWLDASTKRPLLVAFLSIHDYHQWADDHGQCVQAEDDQCRDEIVTCKQCKLH